MIKSLKNIFAALLLLASFSTASLCLATPIYNSDLQARITLDPDMKPDNSPGAIVSDKTLKDATGSAAFGNYMLQVLAGGLISIAAPVAIIIIAIGGLWAVISHGDPGMMGKAKKTVEYAVIGLLIIIFSWVIIRTTISIVITTNSNQSSSSSSTGSPTPGAPAKPTGSSS